MLTLNIGPRKSRTSPTPTTYCPQATTCPYASCGPACRQIFFYSRNFHAKEQTREDHVDENSGQLAPACRPLSRYVTPFIRTKLYYGQADDSGDYAGGQIKPLKKFKFTAKNMTDDQ